jgi:hypothetical protein
MLAIRFESDSEWLSITNEGLNSLMQVPAAAVVEAEAYAEQRAA